jgi:hypothetical protein
MKNNEVDYNNLTDEQKEVYAEAIRDFLRFGPEITKDRISPEAAKILDEFLKEVHNCSRLVKVFTNLFTKAYSVGGLVIAMGKEAAIYELKKGYSKSVWLPCYTGALSGYQERISPHLF